jgi:peptidoglycan/LPS O-acetylase OafA/YrhL
MRHRPSEAIQAKNVNLDLARIVACLWVVSFHWQGNGGFYPEVLGEATFGTPEYIRIIVSSGFLGVDLFFILSGIVLANSFRLGDWRKFAVARVRRLYPTYLVSTVLTALVVVPVINATSDESLENVLSLFWLQYFANSRYFLGAAWSLKYELLFYAAIGLFIFVNSRVRLSRPRVWWLLVASAATLASLLFLATLTTICNPLCVAVSPLVYEVSLGGFACNFILGIMLARLRTNVFSRTEMSLFVLAILVTVTHAFFRLGGRDFDSKDLVGLFIFLLLGVYVSLAVKFNFVLLPRPFTPIVRFNALLTYPVYLLHETFGLSIVSLGLAAGLTWNLSFGLAITLTLAFSVAMVALLDPLISRIRQRNQQSTIRVAVIRK